MEEQNPGEQPAQSQETPTEDSQLQTPQGDQPVPSEAERAAQTEQAPDAEQAAEPTETAPQRDQQAEHDQREADREQQIREHNERSGGGPVHENELADQRDEHNFRTGGGEYGE